MTTANAKQPLKRGDVVASPGQLRVGDVFGVFDRERMFGGVSSLMARVVIARYHDMAAENRARPDQSKIGPGAPNHFHGLLRKITPVEEEDGVPTDTHEVLITADVDEFVISQHKGAPFPDLPENPLIIFETHNDEVSQ